MAFRANVDSQPFALTFDPSRKGQVKDREEQPDHD